MKELLNTAQVAERTGVPVGTLRYWRYIGTGPKSFKLGPRRIVYRAEDVAAWMDRAYAEAVGA